MGAGAAPLIGALSSMSSSFAQSQATLAQGRYQESILKLNARRAEMEAEDAVRRGNEDAQRMHRETKQIIGAQRLAGAASGIAPDSASLTNLMSEAAYLGAVDELTLKDNAYKEAFGLKSEAASLRSQAKFARRGSRYAARSTLISGGLQAARDYTAYRTPTVKRS